MICQFCGNKSTAGCPECGEFRKTTGTAEPPYTFRLPGTPVLAINPQLDRMEAMLVELLERENHNE